MPEPRFYKFDKAEVRYTSRAKMKSERCEKCRYYQHDRGCDIVKGDISPAGWCKRFEPNSFVVREDK